MASDGDLDTIEELLALDFIDRSLLPGQGSSREEYKRSVTEFQAAFSFTYLTIEYQIAEGDMVVTKFSTRCIHRGEFLGVPPSGEEGTYSTIRIHRIAGGKLTDEWSEGNLLEWIMPSFEREIRTRERLEQDLRGCYELWLGDDSIWAWILENYTQATFQTKSGPLSPLIWPSFEKAPLNATTTCARSSMGLGG